MANLKDLSPVSWRDFGDAVIGVDEVGRGCLAGPVYAAAALWTHDEIDAHVTDSKKLTEKRREELDVVIRARVQVCVAWATADEIDQINILQASLLAMSRAITGLAHPRKLPVLIDGNQKIPQLQGYQQTPLVKGDLRCAPISAASIVAKVARDRWMREQNVVHPGYGFDEHKGYLTVQHRNAIQCLGPCVLHRKTFAGVKEFFQTGSARL